MVTQFNKKDMVDFSNYCMSLIQRGMKSPDPAGNMEVTHADFENWKITQDKVTKVRAKFECWQVKEAESDDNPVSVQMTACINGSPENAEFSKYTPGGNLFIAIDKDAKALELFSEGSEYYIDFTKA